MNVAGVWWVGVGASGRAVHPFPGPARSRRRTPHGRRPTVRPKKWGPNRRPPRARHCGHRLRRGHGGSLLRQQRPLRGQLRPRALPAEHCSRGWQACARTRTGETPTQRGWERHPCGCRRPKTTVVSARVGTSTRLRCPHGHYQPPGPAPPGPRIRHRQQEPQPKPVPAAIPTRRNPPSHPHTGRPPDSMLCWGRRGLGGRAHTSHPRPQCATGSRRGQTRRAGSCSRKGP